MSNDPLSQEIGSGDRPRCQEAMGESLLRLGNGRTEVFDDTTAIQKDLNAAEPISTAGDAVTAASVIPDINTARPSNVSATGTSTSTAGDIFEDEMMTIADTLVAIRSTRPRTTLVFEREQRIARERAAEQEAKDAALIEQMEDVQARMDADILLAERLQQEEREQFTIKEKSRMLVDMIAEGKRFFVA
ncbi:hypothetical protein Tco_1059687 [Tanacetum coccineum]